MKTIDVFYEGCSLYSEGKLIGRLEFVGYADGKWYKLEGPMFQNGIVIGLKYYGHYKHEDRALDFLFKSHPITKDNKINLIKIEMYKQ